MPLKFGKLAPKSNPRTLLLAKYLKETSLPIPPEKTFWEYLVQSWGMLGNDQFGDCTCACAAHEVMNRSAHAGALTSPTLDEVLSMYGAICPGFDPSTDSNDNGAAITDALSYMQGTGLSGHKISGWAQIAQTNIEQIKLGIYLFGSVNIGAQFPNSAMDQFNAGKPWDVLADDGGIGGGHCVPLMGYGAAGATCVTWGQRQQMSWEWFAKYCDEAYVEIGTDWLTATGVAPNHLDLASLQADLAAMKAA